MYYLCPGFSRGFSFSGHRSLKLHWQSHVFSDQQLLLKKIYHSLLNADDFFLVDTIDKDSDDDDEGV